MIEIREAPCSFDLRDTTTVVFDQRLTRAIQICPPRAKQILKLGNEISFSLSVFRAIEYFIPIRSLSLCFISLIIRREETTVREISSSMNSLMDRFFSSIYMICSMIFARTNSCVFLRSYISPLDIYIYISLLLLNANGKRKIFLSYPSFGRK